MSATYKELPFELWGPIFQHIYSHKSSISHPPSDFVISPLNARLNIYRCLASVCKAMSQKSFRPG
ncbi:hypothetical protein M422DRAFT_258252 [Sphaerobolus stellatus SS14]|uniref:Uncharacterized protein n=1 Tax=Sphaerobolus stellatus (strain SS14) TaxID=990650 RepID=A0A0C9VN05_SPHS4|nr:hypothetical protein M422DRAFT_258252 [Sphaerobolus stellatus SS14]